MAATSVFDELKNSLDVIWGGQKPVHSGDIALLRGRLLSFGLILTIGFLLLVSLVISAVLAALQKYWIGSFAGTGWLPETGIAWRDV